MSNIGVETLNTAATFKHPHYHTIEPSVVKKTTASRGNLSDFINTLIMSLLVDKINYGGISSHFGNSR